MKLLLDTHALYWWLTDQGRLTPTARVAIAAIDNEIYVSIASPWEMAIKVGSGKWAGATRIVDDFEDNVAAEAFRILPITVPHVRTAGLLQSPHRDPFDRLLAAQAQIEGLTLVTADLKLAGLGAPILW